MIPFEYALKTLLDTVSSEIPLPDELCEYVPFTACCGRILQQFVTSDHDLPPFHKSAVDGYACMHSDLVAGTPLRLLEAIPAGSVAQQIVTSGTCSKIMTGAAMPQGADYVLMVEDASENHGFIRCHRKVGTKTNICLQGEDVTANTPILAPGCNLQPQHIAILTAIGCTSVRVAKKIGVGVISTGDELIEPWEKPLHPQIRNSNSWQLMEQLNRAGALTTYYGIARDNPESFGEIFSSAITENRVVVVTGGVSTGDYDIVPETARHLGFDILFDRVAVQPGKPTTFGVRKGLGSIEGANTSEAEGMDMRESCYFFGLPGNPVSSFVQCELMVKPFLMKLMGANYVPLSLHLPLAHPFSRKQAERMSHLPARIDSSGSCSLVEYHGSGHITALDGVQCLVRIPVGVSSVAAGEAVEIVMV